MAVPNPFTARFITKHEAKLPSVDETPVREDTTKKVLSSGSKKSGTKMSKPLKSDNTGPVRTSQRQIKRPKMDDELIDFESSSRGGSGGGKKSKTATSTSTPKGITTSVCIILLIQILY